MVIHLGFYIKDLALGLYIKFKIKKNDLILIHVLKNASFFGLLQPKQTYSNSTLNNNSNITEYKSIGTLAFKNFS